MKREREWQYYFEKGMKTKLNPDLITTHDMPKYGKYIGMECEILDCRWHFESYAQGCAYSVRVRFENNDEVEFDSAGMLDGGIQY